MERMPVLGAELVVPPYANACALVHTFKDLRVWCGFSLRCGDVLSEL